MTVDLNLLKIGDTIKLLDGSDHVVSKIDSINANEFLVETKTSRIGNNAFFEKCWVHFSNGKFCGEHEPHPADIVAINPENMRISAGGVKHDTGKPDFSCIPQDVLWEVAEVLTRGAERYGKWNWTTGFEHTRLIAAVQRHIAQWSMNVETDDDSDKSHLTHAICGLMMLRALEMRGIGKNDRDSTCNKTA